MFNFRLKYYFLIYRQYELTCYKIGDDTLCASTIENDVNCN